MSGQKTKSAWREKRILDGNMSSTSTPPSKITENDLEKLKDHVRFLHGIQQTEERRSSGGPAFGHRRCSITPEPKLRLNKTFTVRKECVKKRMGNWQADPKLEISELQRMHDLNLKKRKGYLFKLNKAFHMRWKTIRGLPVVHSHFRTVFMDTGKPPFVVPVHYKPFNVYWDADWAKQEFIFLDAAGEEKKKEEKTQKEEEKKRAAAEQERRRLSEIPFRQSSSGGSQTAPGDTSAAAAGSGRESSVSGKVSYAEAKLSDGPAPKVS